MRVTMLACTFANNARMEDETNGEWVPEGDGDAGDLIEFAGRQCYESWGRPNPATATNVGYIGNIIDMAHYSVLEHGTITFRIAGVSRALTHELIRHRHFSFSQQSQRYVNPVDSKDRESHDQRHNHTVPPLFANDATAKEVLDDAWMSAVYSYQRLLREADRILTNYDITDRHVARKLAREAARAVLPNMTPTAIVVTANHRAWLEFFTKRGTVHADQEMRALAVELFRQCNVTEPNVYAGWTVEVVQIGQINTEVIVRV